MEKAQAEDYLHSLLNKTLRVTTTDTRMFLGRFRCTDSDRNIILTSAFEYRLPSQPVPDSTPLTSRYLGQVVVPGPHITRIQVDEFASQVSGGGGAAAVAAVAGGGGDDGR